MGGGASRPQRNRAGTGTAAGAVEEQDPTENVAPAGGNTAQPLAVNQKRLVCTVTDSKSNAMVNFMSSVKNEDGTEAVAVQSIKKDTSNQNSQTLKFGDVAVLTPNAPRRAIVAAPKSWHDVVSDMVCVDNRTDRAPLTSSLPTAIPTNYSLRTCGGHTCAVRAISCSSDGMQFCSSCVGGKVASYFDAASGKMINEIKGHTEGVVCLSLSRDGKFLITASNDCTVVLWDLNNAKRLREVPISSHINAIAVNDESDTIATCTTEDVVSIWEARSCDPLIMFQRHTGPVLCVAFSRRGGLVASGGANGDLFIWTCLTGEPRFHLTSQSRAPVSSVSFSHDAQRVVSIERDVIHVWDLFTGQNVFSRNVAGKISLRSGGSLLSTTEVNATTPRFTCCQFVAGNLILATTNIRQLLLINPNSGEELLSIDVRAFITCLSSTWNGDIAFLGDSAGNHYRLQLTFGPRDVADFAMMSKPPSKERGRLDRD